MNLGEFPPCTHVAFADECNYNDKHSYPSIGLVSLPAYDYKQTTKDLCEILQRSSVSEFKRGKLKTAQYRFAALEFVRYAVQRVRRKTLRIDVLIWDWHDSRHNVLGIDRLENFQRLYYQLLKYVFRSRWDQEPAWLFFPDQHGALDWSAIEGYLGLAEETLEVDPGLLGMGPYKIRLRTDFRIARISEVDSKDEPLIQLADLFAGLGSYARANYDKIVCWRDSDEGGPQPHLPGLGQETDHLSAKDKEHCKVILELNNLCKKHRLGVSLDGSEGLRTLDPKNPINFWWYEPQHEFDKAPTKN